MVPAGVPGRCPWQVLPAGGPSRCSQQVFPAGGPESAPGRCSQQPCPCFPLQARFGTPVTSLCPAAGVGVPTCSSGTCWLLQLPPSTPPSFAQLSAWWGLWEKQALSSLEGVRILLVQENVTPLRNGGAEGVQVPSAAPGTQRQCPGGWGSLWSPGEHMGWTSFCRSQEESVWALSM